MTQKVHHWVPAAAMDSFLANEEPDSPNQRLNEFFVPMSSHLQDSSLFDTNDLRGGAGLDDFGFMDTSNITSTNSSLDYYLNEDGNWTRGNLTDVPQTIRFSLAFQVVIYIIYNTVFVAALLGNTLVCYVVFSSPRMRTVTNYLIANLAIGDLLMALLCVPFSYISVLLQYWPFGEVLCLVVAPAQAVCVFVSAYTLVALAADRYIAILYPLRPRLRRSQAIIVIFLVWTVALLTAVPIAVYTKLTHNPYNDLPECNEMWPSNTLRLIYSLILMVLQYFFPLAVLIFTYARIAVAVWGKKAPGEAEDGRDQRLAKAKRKTVVMSLVVVCGFTFAWFPLNLLNLCTELLPGLLLDPPDYVIYFFFASHALAMAHTAYNPVIYAWINMIKMMLTVVCVYTISWLPFNTIVVYSDLDETIWAWEGMPYVYPFIHWLALSHTVCNPIIYCWMNKQFRTAYSSAISNLPVLKKLRRIRFRRNNSTYRQQEYQLNRMNTCTTYTFASHVGKLGRNSSFFSHGRPVTNGSTILCSHSCVLNHLHRHQRGSLHSSYLNASNGTILNDKQAHDGSSPPRDDSPESMKNCNGRSYEDDYTYNEYSIRLSTIDNTNYNRKLSNALDSPTCPSATITSSYSCASPPTTSLLRAMNAKNRRKRSSRRNKFSRQDSESFV